MLSESCVSMIGPIEACDRLCKLPHHIAILKQVQAACICCPMTLLTCPGESKRRPCILALIWCPNDPP